MKISNHFKKLISGCLTILLAPLSFQLFAADAFTQQEINSSPYLQSVLKRKGQSYDTSKFRKLGPVSYTHLTLPTTPYV